MQHIQLPSIDPGGPVAGMPTPFPLGAGPPGHLQSGGTSLPFGGSLSSGANPNISVAPAELGHWTEEEVNTINGMQGQFSNLRVRKLIDEGASSQVWEGEWAGARVVIKVLREQEALRSFLSEVCERSRTERGPWRTRNLPCTPPPHPGAPDPRIAPDPLSRATP